MPKAFPHFKRRTVDSLNTLWDFIFFEGRSFEDVDPKSLKFDDKLAVPCAFDATPKYLGKRGCGAFRHWISVAPGQESLLEFEAVSFACRIYVDGVLVAEHFCGYAPFSVSVPVSDASKREVIVLAENRFDFDRVPMHEHFFDFYQFGGIIRPVWLHHLTESRIDYIHVDATDFKGGRVQVRGRVAPTGTRQVALSVADVDMETITTEADDSGDFAAEFTIPFPISWSPENPHLYCLEAVCGNDDIMTRFGLREIKTEGTQLVLNGEPLRLLGYNRHEYFPNFGPATPYAQMVNDIQLIKDCGCNFVRGSHYPQDQRFLDLCDEFGLLVWEENLGWGQKPEQLKNTLYQKHHQNSLEEMVLRSYNHPSIIIWGFLNEAATDDESFRPIFERSMSYLRAEGGNRLVTYASNRIERDCFFEEVDIVCINAYPGWYGAEDHPEPLQLIRPFIEEFIQHLADRGLKEKPFMITETGCEGLYGWRDSMRDFHSEEYQMDYLDVMCREVIGNERMAGVCLWHFSDARTYSGGRALGRPRAFNNKGTFDEYRRPKLARDAVRALFRKVSKKP